MKSRPLKPCVVYLGGEIMACYGNRYSFPMAITIMILRQRNPLSSKFQHAMYIFNCTYPEFQCIIITQDNYILAKDNLLAKQMNNFPTS
jgi:hypothetical protein